jgi:hypothetical protein
MDPKTEARDPAVSGRQQRAEGGARARLLDRAERTEVVTGQISRWARRCVPPSCASMTSLVTCSRVKCKIEGAMSAVHVAGNATP